MDEKVHHNFEEMWFETGFSTEYSLVIRFFWCGLIKPRRRSNVRILSWTGAGDLLEYGVRHQMVSPSAGGVQCYQFYLYSASGGHLIGFHFQPVVIKGLWRSVEVVPRTDLLRMSLNLGRTDRFFSSQTLVILVITAGENPTGEDGSSIPLTGKAYE